jgi:hypothetical protein
VHKNIQMKPKKHSPKVLSINMTQLIFDPKVRGPRLRKDVIDAPPKFEQSNPIDGTFIRYDTTQASQWISRLPSLRLKFAEIAYRRIDFIEASLWLDQSISVAMRNRLKLELMQLESDSHPVWENAIQTTRLHPGHLITSTIREWMNEPVDFSEVSFFTPHWESYPYSTQAATSYLRRLSIEAQAALQISIENHIHIESKQEFHFYKLNQSIKNANKQAQILDLGIVFEEL